MAGDWCKVFVRPNAFLPANHDLIISLSSEERDVAAFIIYSHYQTSVLSNLAKGRIAAAGTFACGRYV